jgi:Ca2+-binding EF-hand superfamily protein
MKAVGPEGLLAESDARALFHKYDEDSNGLLDLHEFTNYLTSVFEALADTPAFQAHGATPEEMAAATAEQCFDEADEDGNGSLTFDEFKAWFQAGLDRNIWVKDAMMHTGGEHESSSVWIPESDARKLFDKYDVDSNGSLDLHEFTNYLTSVFEGMAHTPAFQAQDATPAQMAEATAEDCFREADKDGSGLLSFEEFKAWYTSSKTVDATAADFAVTMDGTIEESEARSLFIRFDANKDGVLDFEVISQSLLFLHCSRLRTLTSCLPALCILLLDSEYFLSGVLQLPFVRV